MRHHAYVLEGQGERGISAAEELVRSLGIEPRANPDVITLSYGLLSVEEARKVASVAASAPIGEHKVVIIAASRAYHEAQNALLKIFEEPPPNTTLILMLPSVGGLLPTLRSRVQLIRSSEETVVLPEAAQEFLKAGKEKRSAIAKKLATGKDEEERREHRDEAIAIVGGIEQALFRQGFKGHAATLSDIQTLRGYLYDRSAPVRMILEHLALVIPKSLK